MNSDLSIKPYKAPVMRRMAFKPTCNTMTIYKFGP